MSRLERKEQETTEKKFRIPFFKKNEKKDSVTADSEPKEKENVLTRFKKWFSGLAKWKKITFVAVTTILVILLIVLGIVFFYFSSIFEELFAETPEDYDLSLTAVDGYYNILLLGVDTRDMENLRTRSDAMMVISINEETSDVKILSIYRDTFLKLGSTPTYDKATHACIYGGPEMTMATLNQAMDLNLSNYVVVNFKAVADLVDAVGGIEVDVKDFEIQQLNKYTRQTAKNIGRKKYQKVKEPGVQVLDGCQAVSYSRIRKGVGDDFKRTERMRTVVGLTMDKLKTMKFTELKDIVKMMTPQIQTNLSMTNVLGLAIRLPQYTIMDTTGWPYTVTTGQIEKRSFVFPSTLTSNVIRLHKEFFGQEDYTPSASVIGISNEIINRIEDARKKEQLENEKNKDTSKPSKKPDKTENTGDENKDDSNNTSGSTGNDGGNGSTGNTDNTGNAGNTGNTGNGSDNGSGGDGSSGDNTGNTDDNSGENNGEDNGGNTTGGNDGNVGANDNAA